jgi:hypothetical protein
MYAQHYYFNALPVCSSEAFFGQHNHPQKRNVLQECWLHGDKSEVVTVHTMKMYGNLTSALDGCEWSASQPGHFALE